MTRAVFASSDPRLIDMDVSYVYDGAGNLLSSTTPGGRRTNFVYDADHQMLTAVDPPSAWYVVISPQVSVPTREIFSDPGLTRDTKPVKLAVFFAGGIDVQFHNDLEPVVVRKYPPVARALRWLRSAGVEGRMSGSGASVFAAFDTEAEARSIAAGVPDDMRAFVARGLDFHPLA
jgi:4-diphosphocytidyl-2-C-methyl-D-erythritol kinase